MEYATPNSFEDLRRADDIVVSSSGGIDAADIAAGRLVRKATSWGNQS